MLFCALAIKLLFYLTGVFCVSVMNFTAIVVKEEDMYVAKCAEIGTVSQGKTIEEAVENLKEATGLYLEEFPIKQKNKAILTTFEVASVARA